MARKTPVWQREAAARGYDSTGFYALLKAVDSNHKASPDALRNALVTRIIRKGTKERLGEDPVTGALTFTKKKGEKAADSKAYELVLMLRRVLEDQQRDLKQAQEAAPVALQSLIRKLVNSDSPEDRAWAEQEFLPAYKGNPVLRRLLEAALTAQLREKYTQRRLARQIAGLAGVGKRIPANTIQAEFDLLDAAGLSPLAAAHYAGQYNTFRAFESAAKLRRGLAEYGVALGALDARVQEFKAMHVEQRRLARQRGLEGMTKKALLVEAGILGIKGRSALTKQALISAITVASTYEAVLDAAEAMTAEELGAKKAHERRVRAEEDAKAQAARFVRRGEHRFDVAGGCLVDIQREADDTPKVGTLPRYLRWREKAGGAPGAGVSAGVIRSREAYALISIDVDSELFENWIYPYEYMLRAEVGFDGSGPESEAVKELGPRAPIALWPMQARRLWEFERKSLPVDQQTRQEVDWWMLLDSIQQWANETDEEDVDVAMREWARDAMAMQESPSPLRRSRAKYHAELVQLADQWLKSYGEPAYTVRKVARPLGGVGLVGPGDVVLETEIGTEGVAKLEIKARKLSEEARSEFFESLTTGELRDVATRLGAFSSPYEYMLARQIRNKLESLTNARFNKGDMMWDEHLDRWKRAPRAWESKAVSDATTRYTRMGRGARRGQVLPWSTGELSRLGRADLEDLAVLLGVLKSAERSTGDATQGSTYKALKSARRKVPNTLRGKISRNLAESIYCAKNGARWRKDAHGMNHDMRRYLLYLNTETAGLLATLLKDYGDYPLAELEAGIKPLFRGMTMADIRELQERVHTSAQVSAREAKWLGIWEEAHTHRKELTVRATDLLMGLERAVREAQLPAGAQVSLRGDFGELRSMLDKDSSPLALDVLEDMDEVTIARGCLEQYLRRGA